MFVQKESFLRSLLPRLWCAGCGKESTVAQCVANLAQEIPCAGSQALSRVVQLATPGAGIRLIGMVVFGTQNEGSGC